MKLQLYNTKTRKKEEFKPLTGKKVLLYTCGPTVYHFAHIGNFRAYIFEDLLRRTLQFFDFEVNQAMNITDVDDKTIRGANREKKSLDDFTKPFKESFFQDLKILNIEAAEHYPQATDYMEPMFKIIQKLLDDGYAYKGGDGSLYYAISKFEKYGALSHLKLDELKSGASKRVANDEYEKDHVSDFALWKAYDEERDGPIFWESPYGRGRPGWHLECSAMAINILGETIDIHCGGVDNIFPHHENEIAQSEACTGKTFANYWMHAEHLIVDNKKMSKSLGNFYTLRDILDRGFTGREVRYMLIQTHFQHQLNFTFQELQAVRTSLQRLDDFVQRLHTIKEKANGDQTEPLIKKSEEHFRAALADNLNISAALASLFDLVRECHTLMDSNHVSAEGAQAVLSFLEQCNSVLGFLDTEEEILEIPSDVQDAFEKRLIARQNKDWSTADTLRDEITSKGFEIEDTSTGPRLKKT